MNKKKFLFGFLISFILFVPLLSWISYQLGYCNAADNYIGATECKPMWKLKFFQ